MGSWLNQSNLMPFIRMVWAFGWWTETPPADVGTNFSSCLKICPYPLCLGLSKASKLPFFTFRWGLFISNNPLKNDIGNYPIAVLRTSDYNGFYINLSTTSHCSTLALPPYRKGFFIYGANKIPKNWLVLKREKGIFKQRGVLRFRGEVWLLFCVREIF